MIFFNEAVAGVFLLILTLVLQCVGNWRLLGPLESMTGVLMCGVSVALLFAIINRLIDGDTHRRRKSMVLKTPDLRSTNYVKSSAAHSREHSHG
jgi:hypothetical protein